MAVVLRHCEEACPVLDKEWQSKKLDGFTLVELSIVLVIIGLLIGGILVGQSLISASKVSAQVKQIQQFDITVANFVDKYKNPPGDVRALYTAAETGPCNQGGCGDGFITAGSANIIAGLPYPALYVSYSEVGYFWTQLYRGVNFTQDGASFQFDVSSGFNISSKTVRNSPKAAIDPKTGILAATMTMYYYAPTIAISGYMLGDYSLVVASGVQGIQWNARPSIPSSAALAIDQKMDDGLPLAGIVRALGAGPGSNSAMTPMGNGWLPATCATSTRYYSLDSADCLLVIQIMSQSGGMPKRATTY